MSGESVSRRLPVGAEVQPGGGVHFRCWASGRRQISLVLESGDGHAVGSFDMARDEDGYFTRFVADVGAGALYRYRLDGGEAYPDPASRYQPRGPHGPSQVIDPSTYHWRDVRWRGLTLHGQVVYEMHVGTFTREGTWQSASRQLGELASLGVTAVEVMPVAEFPGRFGWGYDGVDLFAPSHLYGEPDDFRAFVDHAHAAGLGVLLDVVYNHLGPDGSYVREFSEHYFTDKYKNEWGDAINYDGACSRSVREFFVSNAGYWIDEYHLDGLRLDATQTILDGSREHVLAAITERVERAAPNRGVIVVGENEPQHVRLVRPRKEGGFGLDALWNDDFHHSAMVALTGRKEAYYTDYDGGPQELVSVAKRGYLYQGQTYAWQKKRRGTSTRGIAPSAFVNYLQNHDQVANSGRGERVDRLTGPGRLRAMTALLLLLPGTPMLFQGQEFAASSPFLYFADHVRPLADQVREGRREFLAQFPSLATPDMQACLADPGSLETFERCKLDLSERDSYVHVYNLHRDLLALRRADPVFSAQTSDIDGAVLAPEAFVLRFFSDRAEVGDRILIVNLGRDLRLAILPEPLLAPPDGMRWELLWSSEAPRYGACGSAPIDSEEGWTLQGHAASVLKGVPDERPCESATPQA